MIKISWLDKSENVVVLRLVNEKKRNWKAINRKKMKAIGHMMNTMSTW